MYHIILKGCATRGFGSLMDIDKFVPNGENINLHISFGSLMDIDKFVPQPICTGLKLSFGSLMDIDKFVPRTF